MYLSRRQRRQHLTFVIALAILSLPPMFYDVDGVGRPAGYRVRRDGVAEGVAPAIHVASAASCLGHAPVLSGPTGAPRGRADGASPRFNGCRSRGRR